MHILSLPPHSTRIGSAQRARKKADEPSRGRLLGFTFGVALRQHGARQKLLTVSYDKENGRLMILLIVRPILRQAIFSSPPESLPRALYQDNI